MDDSPEDLQRRIRDARAREELENATRAGKKSNPASSDARMAIRVGADLAAAVVVGGVLGYGIDSWLGTRPWAMILMLFLGFAAGFLNIYRAQTGQDLKVGFKKEETKKKDVDQSS